MISRLPGSAAETALLLLLLEGHPGPLTPPEALRELGSSPLWSVVDVRDAITRLEGSGLLIREGDLLFASRAAVRCAALLEA